MGGLKGTKVDLDSNQKPTIQRTGPSDLHVPESGNPMRPPLKKTKHKNMLQRLKLKDVNGKPSNAST